MPAFKRESPSVVAHTRLSLTDLAIISTYFSNNNIPQSTISKLIANAIHIYARALVRQELADDVETVSQAKALMEENGLLTTKKIKKSVIEALIIESLVSEEQIMSGTIKDKRIMDAMSGNISEDDIQEGIKELEKNEESI